MDAPSILLVSRTMPWHIRGGFEEHAWNLAKALLRQGAKVTIVTTAFEDSPERETREGVDIEYVRHLPRNYRKRAVWRWWSRFPRAAHRRVLERRLKVDLLISEGRGGRKLLLRKRVHAGRTVYVCHGTFEQNYRLFGRPDLLSRVSAAHPRAIAQALHHRWQHRGDRRDLHRAKHVVAVSPFVARSVYTDYEVPREKIKVIGNGVMLPPEPRPQAVARRKLGLGPGVFLLFLGRLEAVKGPLEMLPMLKQHPDWRLLVAGTGPEADKIKAALGADPDLRDRVVLLGRVSDEQKWDLYAACDVFVLPSKSEGEPITILEALGMARRVVTTEQWVAPDVKSGCVIDTNVARAVTTALSHEFPLEVVARQVRSRHTWDAVAAEFMGFIRP